MSVCCRLPTLGFFCFFEQCASILHQFKSVNFKYTPKKAYNLILFSKKHLYIADYLHSDLLNKYKISYEVLIKFFKD